MAQAYRTESKAARPQTRLRVKQGGKPNPRVDFKLIRSIALAALMLALVCSVLLSHAQLSELTMDLQDEQLALRAEENTHNYLTGQLNSKTNMRNVEEAAAGELGLVKLDPAQVTYFTLDGEGKLDKPQSGTQKLAGWFESGMFSLMDDLAP